MYTEEQYEMNNDELLFFVGITMAIIAFVLLIVLSVLFRLKERKLSEQFDNEYGADTKMGSQEDRKPKRKL